jgi:putative ABC transport system permease protein
MNLKHAIRRLFKAPGFTVIAILTLALGIGANTSMFSFVNAWILRPSPFPQDTQLVVLFETDSKSGNTRPVAPADWRDWREKSGVFQELAAMRFASYNLTGVDEPQKVEAIDVTANYFRTLGIKPALGRDFFDSEQTPGRDNVVILSHALWHDHFASDPNILNKQVMLDGAATTVVGVMPENFQYIPLGRAELWRPLALSPEAAASRDALFLQTVARLAPGADLAHARAAMAGLQSSLQHAYPATNANRGVLLISLREAINQQSGNDAVMLMFATVSFVLLMACANVANLIMARATGRRREMAVRLAIGAGRWQLVRDLLGETLLLFLSGAAIGVLFARGLTSFLLSVIPARSFPYLPNFGRVDMNWQVLLFTVAVALLTGLAFGLAPALEGTRFDVNSMLKDTSARAGSPSGGRFRRILVAGEMALAVVVVVCGALLSNSFIRMLSIDPGFRADRVVVAEMQLPQKHDTAAAVSHFYDSVLERLSGMPGVERATAAMFTPFSNGGNRTYLFVEGRPEPPLAQAHWARANVVRPGYLEAMSIPLLSGRTISRVDGAEAMPAVVIGETVAKREFPGENPLGKRIRLSRTDPRWRTIVGVVKDIKYYQLAAPPENQVYLAAAQMSERNMSIVVRTGRDAAAAMQSIRSVVRSVDASQPVSNITTIARQIEDRNAPDKILAELAGWFGALALFLAAIGVYGVTAYSVSQRTREIGVRMALGARVGDILRLIVRQGMLMVFGGMLVGLAGALAMARLLARFLYGIQPSDPATFTGTFVLLAAVALLACAIPARRASRVDPLTALRYE